MQSAARFWPVEMVRLFIEHWFDIESQAGVEALRRADDKKVIRHRRTTCIPTECNKQHDIYVSIKPSSMYTHRCKILCGHCSRQHLYTHHCKIYVWAPFSTSDAYSPLLDMLPQLSTVRCLAMLLFSVAFFGSSF